MGESIVIRRAEAGDLPALLQLYRDLHAADDAADADRLRQAWAEICANPRIHCLLGEWQGAPVCSCMLVIVPNLTRGARPYALIENVVTHAGFRRRGFARTLLEHALGLAWGQGCYKVMLLSSVERTGAHRLYEQAGFRGDRKHGFVAYPPEG